ncbi:UNVERIFIED_CONTAM: hypothetical protein PYX00_006289 [Menopon gallinae]|uniref:Beta-lactamase-like protein 2 homolog n=1 Tax=Menopon gallinae TaxID=328185 RepID=A0AAW2HUU2_9NEOP
MSNIPLISRLSSTVIRILGCNPGPMTLQGTNTYLIGTGKKRLLLDAGDPSVSEYTNTLEKVLKEENVEIGTIIITHWHHDHIGGVPDVIRLNGMCEVTKFKRDDFPDEPLPGDTPMRFLVDKETIKTEGATLTVHHTPGHTRDHIVLHLAEENALFSGDCILGQGTAVFEDLHDYLKSLHLILQLKPDVIYPGHGPVLDDPIPSIKYYIEHRMKRESEILTVLKKEINKSFTEMEIVKRIYTDTPEHLHAAAASNVFHHLTKLQKDGQVIEKDGKWSYAKKSQL